MVKRKKSQGAQHTTLVIDASNKSPPYEIASKKVNTNKAEKIKEKKMLPNFCRCKDNKKNNNRPKTWGSITKMYGDADTTEVWNGEKIKPNILLTSKNGNFNRGEITNTFENKKIINTPIIARKLNPKGNKRNKFITNSIISLYRKPKKKNKHTNISKNLNNKDLTKNEKHKIGFPFANLTMEKGMRINFPVDFQKANDVCIKGPCTDRLECFNKTDKYKNDNKLAQLRKQENLCKCKMKALNNKDFLFQNLFIEPTEKIYGINEYNENNRTKEVKSASPKKLKKFTNINVGHGDQSAQLTHCNCKCNVSRFFFRRPCQCRFGKKHYSQAVYDAGDQTGEPVFIMRVDSQNMRVLNSNEIKSKVRNYGRFQRKRSCVCPSRFKRKLCLKSDHKQICKEGICEKVHKNRHTNFNCKCIKKNNIIDCKDSTCDIKKKNNPQNKVRLLRSLCTEKNKPLFEVMLDADDMNIINTNEIEQILKKSSNKEICPTGICNLPEQNKEIQIKCKCINKKIIPVNECTKETCRKPERKCKLSYLCSRIFSKSENWNGQDINFMRKRKKRTKNKTEKDKENIKANSDIYRRNGLFIKVSKGQAKKPRAPREISPVKCSCKLDNKLITKIDVSTKKDKVKKVSKRKKKSTCKRKKKLRDQRLLILRQTNMTLTQRILYCLKRKHKRCERRLKKEESEFASDERKKIKENMKIKKLQMKNSYTEEDHWNCITKFISGVLNLTFQSVKNIIITAFSIVTNPIGSYVYARERTRNPNATCNRFSEWLKRTWQNRSSKLSKPLKDSNTLNVIADQIEDSVVFDTLFANKGRTPRERAIYERKMKLRKRRIRKRHDQALYGCRHMLLTTMRKTPCLWFYHICPDMYPQCLSFVNFMNNFLHIIFYFGAFICWTPCIVCFELCRAFMCCFLCTN